ncbi:MAG TPA: type II toxin-antitoxin system VapC family toxin [Acidimicrobiales bacterium]|nr:type II toxin-antitoxin system VapC family toxin [Acidimicrobiales bacterium]
MRLLLDTHALIWAARDPGRLSARAAAAIRDQDNDVWVSAASGWEIAIKRARGRLNFPDPDREMLGQLGMTELSIALVHGAEVARLPDHHRDPFDRMLIAQARVEQLSLVSADGAIAAYDVEVCW